VLGLKVLITGGYGFIGSHLADFFFKEGHQIYIIDNLSTGNTANIKFKHKSYILDMTDRKCDEVFKANKFNVVIHAASQSDTAKAIDNPLSDSKSDFLGMLNMLNLSAKHKISKFVYISSVSVYGSTEVLPAKEEDITDPESMNGVSKLSCEIYCRKWSELYNLNTLIMRISNAYGPRQPVNAEGGIIANLINKVISSQDLNINVNSEQARDYIYVEDVAQAIYKSVESDLQGVYNVSYGSETTIGSIVELIKEYSTVKGVVKYDTAISGIQHFYADNTKIKRELDWVPMHNIEDGIKKTLSWQVSYPVEKIEKKTNPKKVGGYFNKVIMPYIENFLAFAAIVAVSIFLKEGITGNLPLFLSIYILFIGITYGTRQSILCVILSSALYIYNQMSLGREPVSMFYDSSTLFQISLFILIGLAVGYTIDKKESKISEKTNELELLQAKYDFLTGIYDDTRIVKEQLHSQIVSSEDSFGKVFSLTKQLDSLEPEVVYYSTIYVIESVMKSKKVALYILDSKGSYLRLMSKSNIDDFNIPNSIKIEENEIMKNIIHNKTMYINKNIDASMPLMIAPMLDKKRVVAIAAIYDAEFDNITLYYKNLFQGVVGLISASITKAIKFENLLAEKKYIKDTFIMKDEYFANLLKIKLDAKGKVNMDFVLLEINIDNASLEDLSHIITNNLRENDYIGMIDNQLYILLSNTNASQSRKVIERLAEDGIEIFNNGAIAYD
jgi:nucleoside-diphosphate-sugar epimerase